MSNPLISIIITYYKKKKYIQETIESIKRQSHRNFQLIFVYDDTDKKDINYIKKIIQKIKTKKLIINKKNLGVAVSRNIALKYIRGKFTAFIDADDIWKKDKLKDQLIYMLKSNADISYTSYEIIDTTGRLLGKRIVSNNIFYKSLL